MADKQKTIDIIFGAVDKTGSGFSSVGNNLSSLESNIGSITAPVANITTSILKLDAALAAAAAALTAYGIKAADDFGTAFAEISTIIGQPAADLGDFKDNLQDYAQQSTASFDEITNATYNAISAGVDYKDALQVIEQAESLSIAGKAELGVTTKALVSTMNAFGAEMSEAGDFADVFFTVVQKGQTTLPELADSIGKVAPLAAQAGLSFDELGAAVAAITAGAGISTAEAMTALQQTLSNIIKPSQQAADLAAELGINFNAAALETLGLSGVLEEAKNATGGNVEQMSLLFGSVRSLNAVLPLTGTAADDFTAAMQAMEGRTGATSTAAKELATDLGLLTQTLQNNVTAAFQNFGARFTDESAGIITAATSIFETLATELKLNDGTFAPLLEQFEGLFVDIQGRFEAMARNMPEALDGLDFSSLVRAFDGLGDELGDAFEAIFGDVDLSTVEGLRSAMQTTVDAFTALVNISKGIIDGLEPLFDLIREGATHFNELDERTAESIGNFGGLLTVINTLLPVLGVLSTAFVTIGGTIVTISGAKYLGGLIGGLASLSKMASLAGPTGFIGAALFGAGVGGGIGAAINAAFEAINDDSIGTALYNIFGDDDAEVLGKMTYTLKDFGLTLEDVTEKQKEATEASAESADFNRLNIDHLNELAAETIAAAKASKEMGDSFEENAEAGEKAGGTLSFVANEANKTSKELVEAAKATEEYQIKLLELASDERIASIEATVELNIAQLEADTKTAVAIIESLGTSIESTGNLLGDLYNAQNDASKFDKLDIQQQIRAEEERRQQAFEKQQQLTDAEIRLIKQKAAALSKGEAVIKVNAEGLTPALEYIFNEILVAAQVRATEEGLEFLTGI